ncbi:MAG: Rrf2 family transcriptional regulator [Nitrospiraceae bacterium]|nr:Rrf2 family transcriptional regulator [Nitrospiraceae bacterium]
MLKLSTKGQYGVRAMFEIARGYPGKPINIKEISARQDVSVPYLEQILNTLRRAGLITSIKGPGGGYVLSMDPGGISIGQILKELDGPVALTACADPLEGCIRADGCVTSLLWRALGEKIESFLDTITLGDLSHKKSLRKHIGKLDHAVKTVPRQGEKQGRRREARKTPASEGSLGQGARV